MLTGMSWATAGNLVGQAAWFGSLIVLGALLPPSAFGVVAVGLVIANASNLLQDAGTRGSVVTSRSLTRAWVGRTVARNVGTGLAIAALTAALAGPIADVFAGGRDPEVIAVLVLSIAIRAFSIVPLAVLQRTMHFREHAAVNAGAMVGAAALAVAAAAADAGVWALVVRQVAFSLLLAAGAWRAARAPLAAELERAAGEPDQAPARGRPFLALAVADFVAFNVDTAIVGGLAGAGQLGLYSLAFTLAFAPLTQFSWQIGRVLFGAAAADDASATAKRTLRALAGSAVLLLPVLPPAVALAPVAIPELLGAEWEGMVAPFQVLLCVGVVHGVVNVIGESLSGTGGIGFRARVHVAWATAMVLAVAVLVDAEGIRGAAWAHALVTVPLAAAYLGPGARRLGTSPREVWHALRGVVGAVALQAAATAATAALLGDAPDAIAAGAGAAAGIAVLALALPRLAPDVVGEARAALGRSRGSAA